MGEVIEFKCNCGYTREIYEDIGFIEYELDPNKKEVWIISALCTDCSEVIGIISDDEIPKCNTCNGNRVIPYKDPCLSKAGQKTIQRRREIQKEENIDEKEKLAKFLKGMANSCILMGKNPFDELNKPENSDIKAFILDGVVGECKPEQEDMDDVLDLSALDDENDENCKYDEDMDNDFDLSPLDDENDEDCEYYDKVVDVTYYLCPKCNKFLMERFCVGMYD